MKRFSARLLCVLLLLTGCTKVVSSPIQLELTNNYDTSDPFINEKLFYVDENIDVLILDINFQMEGGSGVLEIADNQTKQVIWSDSWNGNVEGTEFTASLGSIEKGKEYVIRFTGTKIKYAKIVVTSEDNLIKERAKSLK